MGIVGKVREVEVRQKGNIGGDSNEGSSQKLLRVGQDGWSSRRIWGRQIGRECINLGMT